MKVSPEQMNRFEVFVSGLLVLLALGGESSVYSFFSGTVASLSLVLVFLFFLLAYFYLVPQTRTQKGRHALIHSTFAVIVLFFLLIALAGGPALPGIAASEVSSLANIGEFFTLYIPLFFTMFLGMELWREHGNKKAAAVLFAVALLISILYFLSHFLITSISLNDEVFLMMQSVGITLRGANPYATSVAQSIFSNATAVGGTITTYNRIVGVMDYPALYFLSFMPFYFLSPPNTTGLSRIDLPAQAVVFLLIAILALAFSLDRQKLLRPSVLLLVFFTIGVIINVSVTTYLMIALLLLAYAKIGSRYAWLPLGLCLSLQEELWLPVALLLIYSFNSHGFRRGARNALGAFAVFLAVNSYFILLSPGAFFGAIFPLSSTFLPNGTSPLGFFLLLNYPLLFSTYSTLFELATVFVVLLFAYTNRKELIPLFSLAPFVIWQHSLPAYYAFFIFFLVFAISTMKAGRMRIGHIQRFLRRRRLLFYSTLAVVVFTAVCVAYASHSAYARGFNISASNAALALSNATSSSVYRATLHYRNLSNNTIYLYVIYYSGTSYAVAGLFGERLLNSTPACGSYECLVNVNRVDLPAGATSYDLRVNVPWAFYNSTLQARYVSVSIYNGQYFYVLPSAYNASA